MAHVGFAGCYTEPTSLPERLCACVLFPSAELSPWCSSQKCARGVRRGAFVWLKSLLSSLLLPWPMCVVAMEMCAGVGGVSLLRLLLLPTPRGSALNWGPQEAVGTAWSRRRVSAEGRLGLGQRPHSVSDATVCHVALRRRWRPPVAERGGRRRKKRCGSGHVGQGGVLPQHLPEQTVREREGKAPCPCFQWFGVQNVRFCSFCKDPATSIPESR